MKLFYSILLSLLSSLVLIAQPIKKSNKELDILVKEYNELFIKTNFWADSLHRNRTEINSGLWNEFIIDNKTYKTETTLNNQFQLKSRSFFSYGFVWVSDVIHNLSTGITENEDVFFRSRVSTGIDWLLLGDGSYQKNKKNNYVLKNELRKDSLEIQLLDKATTLQNKQIVIKEVFDRHKLNLLKSFRNLLSQKADYYNNLQKAQLYNHASKIKIDNELQKVTNLIKLKTQYLSDETNEYLIKKYWDLPLGSHDLPDFDSIRIDLLLSDQKKINELQKEILTSKNKSSETVSLRAKVRYNYYDSEDQKARAFASVGASLSIPLNSSKNDEIVKYRMEAYDSKLNYQRNQLKEELLTKHYDFYVLKNELKTIENDIIYLEALLKNEIEVYNKKDKNFSPEKYISYTIGLFEKNLEILNIKQQLCEQYLMFNYLIDENLKQKSTIEANSIQEQSSVNISSYLWKKYFEENTNDYLIDKLQENNITKLFLSPGNNLTKAEEFINLAKQNNIEVSRLIGENSFAKTQEGTDKLLEKLQEVSALNYSGIHLDIEPHTFDDYKANKQKYIEIMNEIYLVAKKWCNENNKTLTVSIPLNLPIENAKVLKANNIDAYIMAYENTNQDKLLKRTEELRNVLKDNFVWVLRLSDFENKEELNNAITILNNNEIYKLGYYDVSMLKSNSQ